MTQPTPYYLKKIRDEFTARTERRESYSLRSFARFLGIEAASLSSVMKGVRSLPLEKAETIVSKLNLSPEEQVLFLKSLAERARSKKKAVLPAAAPVPRHVLNDEAHFRIMAEWEHYAILSLMETEDFKSDAKWIAKRLGLTELRVHVCVENLLGSGLIKADGANLTLAQNGVATTEDIPSQAIRKGRRQDLDLAITALEEISVDLRDISSCTMTVNPEDLQELKDVIRDFRRRFMQKAETKKGKEVYKLAVQFFPLTKTGDMK